LHSHSFDQDPNDHFSGIFDHLLQIPERSLYERPFALRKNSLPVMSKQSKHTLVQVTQDFVNILISSKGDEVDFNTASGSLGPSKRRLYDVINVLEGIGVIERCGKARVRLIDSGAVDDGGQLKELLGKEAEVDRMNSVIDQMLTSLFQSSEFQDFAWVSDDEVEKLTDELFTLFALHGPSDLTIEVPQEDGTEKHSIKCTSKLGSIELIPISQSGRYRFDVK
jgi:hypothetical protein